MKYVYVSLIADLVHGGHFSVLKEAKRHGDVTVGLLTSTAINELDDIAYLKYKQRLSVVEYLEMVPKVVSQDSASYFNYLIDLKPDVVVHGDDWKQGPQSKYREEVVNLLNQWGAKLIEIEYSKDISDQNIKQQLLKGVFYV
jgi:phosphoenolpyruvate phosphomutase / 2-hydroxyethylphosphonate cytidylyltransferase